MRLFDPLKPSLLTLSHRFLCWSCLLLTRTLNPWSMLRFLNPKSRPATSKVGLLYTPIHAHPFCPSSSNTPSPFIPSASTLQTHSPLSKTKVSSHLCACLVLLLLIYLFFLRCSSLLYLTLRKTINIHTPSVILALFLTIT